mmetsp:Transcript_13570/g.18978  ORF Transcript_13570/g.18978 Transcript_13570/m.18978 type:complete len:161 (-) Transcript_13570:93-575(-)
MKLSSAMIALLGATPLLAFSPNAFCHKQHVGSGQMIFSSAGDNDIDEQQQQQPSEAERIMEQASRVGANQIKELSIAERTKRAMMAEAVEDRIFSMYEDLEKLMNEDGTLEVDDREQATDLAKQIKASQEQYETLVSGRPSSMLDQLSTSVVNDDKKKED